MNAPDPIRPIPAREELERLLVSKIDGFDGDFDEWLRTGDRDDIELAYELVQSCATPLRTKPLTRSDCDHRLERLWLELVTELIGVRRDQAEFDREMGRTTARSSEAREYAQAAACEARDAEPPRCYAEIRGV